ncbi:MAG: hypothetical protein ACRYGR_00940 [Janthinobacterium lividum]
MNRKLKKKSWSAQEKAHLDIGHKLGASLKTMAIVLDRSESALNKALGRLGIRQYGANKRGKKSKAERFFMVTPQIFRDQIAAYNSQSNKYQHEINSIAISSQTNNEPTSKLYPNPWITFPKRQVYPLPLCLNLDYMITFLKRKGHKIQRCSENGKILGGVKIEFYFNGIPMSAAQLLMRANRLRLEQGLEPFYVDSITEH